jgi:o-succinylbenzoate---CoA ligase
VSEVASALARSGIRPREPLAALVASARAYALLLHAAQSSGWVLLPLNARLTHGELAQQLAASGVRAIVSDAAEAQRADALAAEAGIAGLRIAADASVERVIAAREQSSPSLGESGALLWLFTSGTSGAPKIAELSLRALRASALGHIELIGLAPGERWLACLPMFHIGALSILVRCALAGASAELHDRFEADAVAAALASGRIAHVSLVPTMLVRVLDAWGERPAPPALRCVLLGGAAAPEALLERAAALGFPIAPTYGLTEAGSQVATQPPGERGMRALPGTSLRIDGGPEGGICVRGPTLMTRYVGAPDETRRALRDGWLRTGDFGRLDEDGVLAVLDRRSDLIVSGGENVYPAEIESALCEHPSVQEAGVVARADTAFGARPVAWVALRPGARVSEASLREHCAARLARFKLPVAFRFSDALPRTASGKLLRRELREREALLVADTRR